jgi:hypothetical protein
MSYLNSLRLHFAGQFQANISTVNNDPAHFDNASFQSSYQAMQGASGPPNGWFNPSGDANFRLLGCSVTSAWTSSGQVPGSDPVLGYIVADSDQAVPAKLVDLDPEQQLVSEIWGLELRIADAQGNTLLRSDVVPPAFIDIWNRATSSAGGDTGAGAAYQAVLTGLEWGDVSGSTFLGDLQKASTASGTLSIKFNVDGLSMDFTSPQFMCGRIVGTIGPAAVGEPNQLVVGRQFMAIMQETPSFPVPTGGINFFPAVVDTGASAIYLDLGNALSTVEDGGPLNNVGDLTLSVLDPIATPGNPAGTMVPLGTIPASLYADSAGAWYRATAGVAVLPLTDEQLALVAAAPLALTGNTGISISEAPSGAFLRADRFVYRTSPGDNVQIPVYAMQWGNPLAGAEVTWSLDESQLQPAPTPNQPPYLGTGPAVGTPTGALAFPPGATTDSSGVAVLDVTAGDPGTPRWLNGGYGIDGQVYGIRPAFADSSLAQGPVNQWNFISFLVWSGFTAASPPTWTDVQPIFQQYGNLYPVMLRFLDLTCYDSVTANIGLLQMAFSLDPSDSNAMPVTRDLSPAKRAAILAWLGNPLPGAAPAAKAEVAAARAAPPAVGAEISAKGGKAAAMARRLVVQNR